MLLVLHVLGLTTTRPDAVTVRNFSFVDDKGESVLRPDFDWRRLSDGFAASPFAPRRLTLKFSAVERQFQFQFQKNYPIFTPDATIQINEQVRSYCSTLVLT